MAGYNAVEKVEGLTAIDANTIALINDNDFGVAAINIDTATGTFTLAPGYTPEPIVLGLITTRNGIDASDRDVPGPSNNGILNIRNWPVLGMYQPDAIASFQIDGETYLITANEGDARDYTGFAEEARVGTLSLDAASFAERGFSDVSTALTGLRNNDNLGRLNVTNTLGNTDADSDFERLYAFGARSFSIWNAAGQLVFDSGDDLEQITASAFPAFFNPSNDDNSFDSRSDNKGPEPEFQRPAWRIPRQLRGRIPSILIQSDVCHLFGVTSRESSERALGFRKRSFGLRGNAPVVGLRVFRSHATKPAFSRQAGDASAERTSAQTGRRRMPRHRGRARAGRPGTRAIIQYERARAHDPKLDLCHRLAVLTTE